MGLFDLYRLNAAAKRYARRLPAQLRKDYGAAEFYTAAQIMASVRRAKLPDAYMAFGLAKYLPREVFDETVETEYSYDFLNARLAAYLPSRPSDQIEPVGMNINVAGGAGTGP